MTITAAQCRAARMLAGMSQAELAGVAVVPATLITDYETGVGMPEPSDLEAIQSALEWAGVEFTNGGQPGVRLRGPVRAAPSPPTS
jgi:transcriptional regulator with XRE-family HTH domain